MEDAAAGTSEVRKQITMKRENHENSVQHDRTLPSYIIAQSYTGQRREKSWQEKV